MKRGQLFADILMGGIALFVLGVVIVVMTYVSSNVNDSFQNSTVYNESGKAVMESAIGDYGSVWDGVFIFFFGGLWAFYILSGFFLDSHPIFFIILFIAMIAVFVVLMTLGNTFVQFISGQSDLANASDLLPYTSWVMSHVLELFILVFLTAAIALYGKKSSGGAGL